jgi:predicted metal-dependent peptidase
MAKTIVAISRALSRLVLRQAWFASLALRLIVKEDDSIPTAAVDGVTLFYNPTWFASLDPRFQEGVLAHEVMHCALLHMTRRGGRDAETWNMAGDHVINLELKKAGFTLPGDCLADPRFAGMASEQVYAVLHHEKQKQGGKGKPGQGGGQGQGQGSYVDPLGGVKDAPQAPPPSPSKGKGQGQTQAPPQGKPTPSPSDLEADWKIATTQASMVAQKAGNLPGGADRAARKERETREDWRSVMQRYLVLPGDVSWTTPNRRMISRGMYLPGPRVDRVGNVVIAVDTSGSISQGLLTAFASEVSGILNAFGWPAKVSVIYCDAQIQHMEEITEGDVQLAAHGGGGTACLPVFDKVAEDPEYPQVLFYLTDLYIPDYARVTPPPYPVVWVAPLHSEGYRPPFGEVVRVETEE